jgi:hypothetical protein
MNRMLHYRLAQIFKKFYTEGRKYLGRAMKRLMDGWNEAEVAHLYGSYNVDCCEALLGLEIEEKLELLLS